MLRRPWFAAALVALQLAGPFGLQELEHARCHEHGNTASVDLDCPVCLAAKTPIDAWPPSTPLSVVEPEGVAPVLPVALPDCPACRLPAFPRGPPACS